MSVLARIYADVATQLRQSATYLCDLHTAEAGDDHIVTLDGNAATVIRILGVRRVLRDGNPEDPVDGDVRFHAAGLREDLRGVLEHPGHILDWHFSSDPALAVPGIEEMCANARRMADRLGYNLDMLLDERRRRFPSLVRWEACHLVLWTRRSVLGREESKAADAERAAASKGVPPLGDAQSPFLALSPLVNRHRAFVDRALRALHHQGIAHETMPAWAMAQAVREDLRPRTTGEDWRPRMLDQPVLPRQPQQDGAKPAEWLLPPSIRDQIFQGLPCEPASQTTALVGDDVWGSVDMVLGPDNPAPFQRLVSDLAADDMPWRVRLLMEGGGASMFSLKSTAATLLGFGENRKIFKALDENKRKRAENEDVTVKLRVSLATRAPAGHGALLAKRRGLLEHRVATWGDIQAAPIAGDPVAGVLSSALGLAPASTAVANEAPLADALLMAPWGRQGSPYRSGGVLYRKPDKRMWFWDPVGHGRQRRLNLFSGPSRHGKSVNANYNLLATCLGSAAEGPQGARLPLIGKLDIGHSARGLVDLLRASAAEGRKDEALYIPYRFTDEFAFNVLGTQLGYRYPLPLEYAFLENFLALASTGYGVPPFEGMNQMIRMVVHEAYRMLSTEGPNRYTKPFLPNHNPAVDAALERAKVRLTPGPHTHWWHAVDALFDAGDLRGAELAQRRAEPLLEDLVTASRADRVWHQFAGVCPQPPENIREIFTRYLRDFIDKYPSLNRPTRLDFGRARVIVIDLGAVAPAGSPGAEWQTRMVYMLGRHMIARKFFLHPDYADEAPPRYREHHRQAFRGVQETLKVVDYDEFHRPAADPNVLAVVNRDAREGPKHNVDLNLSSQAGEDFGPYLLGHATAHFIHGVGGGDEAGRLGALMGLSPSTRSIITHSLKGPDPRGSGAPFVLVTDVNGVRYEQMLVLSPGPVELWALSTTPEDTALRGRLYDRLGVNEALRRLATAFAEGTARTEVQRRVEVRMARKKGLDEDAAQQGVVDEIADELWRGVGLGAPR